MLISQGDPFATTTATAVEPLVIVPGFMADARSFMPQVARLGEQCPIMVLTTGLADTVEKIVAFAGPMLPRRFALLGHGLGGNVAIEILRRHPDAVSRIALIATDPLPEPPKRAAELEALLVAAKTGHMADCIAKMLPATALHDAPWRGEILDLVQDMAATLGIDQFQRQLRMLQRRPDQQKTLRKANVPTLILTGEADTIVTRRRAEFLAKLMPQGCVEIIAGAGHLPQLEQPESVTRRLQTFLAGRLPTLLLT